MKMSDSIIMGQSMIPETGRLGNQFFRAMACHFISQNLEIAASYADIRLEENFGLKLHNKTYIDRYPKNCVFLSEVDIVPYTRRKEKLSPCTVLSINHIYCQTSEFAVKIRNFLKENKEAILSKNIFSNRGNVFVHVRLGDMPHYNPGVGYYKSVLSKLEFKKGYISSDTIDHPICKELIETYNLTPINMNEVETIKFGSSCEYIVLSHGTFSWIIGVLGFDSKVYYPEIKKKWHGDIFECMTDWNKISY